MIVAIEICSGRIACCAAQGYQNAAERIETAFEIAAHAAADRESVFYCYEVLGSLIREQVCITAIRRREIKV